MVSDMANTFSPLWLALGLAKTLFAGIPKFDERMGFYDSFGDWGHALSIAYLMITRA